jgi:hypothetical protein
MKHERNELRVFATLEEMERNYHEFCQCAADQFHLRDRTARWHDEFGKAWRVHWTYGARALDAIYGRCFNRIYCDIDIDTQTQKHIMSRLRCPNYKVEPMHVFYKEIRLMM